MLAGGGGAGGLASACDSSGGGGGGSGRCGGQHTAGSAHQLSTAAVAQATVVEQAAAVALQPVAAEGHWAAACSSLLVVGPCFNGPQQNGTTSSRKDAELWVSKAAAAAAVSLAEGVCCKHSWHMGTLSACRVCCATLLSCLCLCCCCCFVRSCEQQAHQRVQAGIL